MEEIRDKVIVIKSVNHKEKDKIVTLFSLSQGLLKATLKGVLNPKAKLKFLAQPLCFADVCLVKKGDFYTVTSAIPIETFFSLASDLDKFLNASTVLEILSTFSLNESAYPEIFVSALKAFEQMEFENVNPKLAVIKFMLKVFREAGYGFILDRCSECGSKILTEPYFDLDSGNILCLSCKNAFSIKLSNLVLSNLKILDAENFEKLGSIKVSNSVIDEILKLLKQAYKSKFNILLKTI